MKSLVTLLAVSAGVVAADPPAWMPVLGELAKTEKAGFGGLCGVAVDPAAGTVWVNLSDRGFYRSDDQAKTFRRCGDEQPTGRSVEPRPRSATRRGGTSSPRRRPPHGLHQFLIRLRSRPSAP